MKLKFILCLIVSLIFCYSLFSQEVAEIETKQIELVARIIKNSTSTKMQEVWPGYQLRTKPIFITFENGHIYAFNIKMPEKEWKHSQIEGLEVLYTDQDKWGIMAAPMQFDFDIHGQQAFIFRLDMVSGPPFLPFFVMVHERFHVYQIQNFKSEKTDAERDYPESEHADNLALMQIEERILLDFLTALENNSREEAISHLKTFISVHKERRKLLSPQSIAWEGRQQMVEGLADYTAAKNLDVFGYFGAKVGQKHLHHTMLSYTKENDINERALKWRHYGVGASIGYALDFLQVPSWKKNVEQNISLQNILEKHLRSSPQEEKSFFAQAAEKYQLKQLKTEIKEKISSYNRMLQSHIDGYKKLPGVIINIQTPPDSGLSAGGHSKGVYSLKDGSMFSYLDTSKTSSADNRWILELRSIPYLFQTNDGFRRFKADAKDLTLIIDGQNYLLQNVGQKRFQQLVLKSESCSFKSTHNQGVVSWRDGELSIIYRAS